MLQQTSFADRQSFPKSLAGRSSAPSFHLKFVEFFREQQHLAVFRAINLCLRGREGVVLVLEKEQSLGSKVILHKNSDQTGMKYHVFPAESLLASPRNI